MGGFIALTTQEWISSIRDSGIREAVFWRKRKTFKAIGPGENFYFLQRGSVLQNDNRYIVGKGVFVKNELLRADLAWNLYGEKLGFENSGQFFKEIYNIYKEKNPELACLTLNQILFYKKPVAIVDVGVKFSPYTVSGKKISETECKCIDRASEEAIYE